MSSYLRPILVNCRDYNTCKDPYRIWQTFEDRIFRLGKSHWISLCSAIWWVDTTISLEIIFPHVFPFNAIFFSKHHWGLGVHNWLQRGLIPHIQATLMSQNSHTVFLFLVTVHKWMASEHEAERPDARALQREKERERRRLRDRQRRQNMSQEQREKHLARRRRNYQLRRLRAQNAQLLASQQTHLSMGTAPPDPKMIEPHSSCVPQFELPITSTTQG